MGIRSEAQVVLITGASSGIGEATAREFTRRGYDVVLAARRIDRLRRLAEALRDSYPERRPMAVEVDVSEADDVHACVETALDQYGRLDVLFANAGVAALGWLEELDPQQGIAVQLETNLTGVIFSAREVLPHMQARRKGHIILMSSLAGWIPTPTYSVYAASKFGVRGFGGALRREVSAWGIRVSTVFVGAVKTGFAADAVQRRKTGWTTPPSLVVSPDRLARKIVDLAQRPRATIVLPGIFRPIIWLDAVWPGLIDRMSERMFVRRERNTELSESPADIEARV
jgi:NADP-dependent 3-hydroxy acid dehydrogenase YdfG